MIQNITKKPDLLPSDDFTIKKILHKIKRKMISFLINYLPEDRQKINIIFNMKALQSSRKRWFKKNYKWPKSIHLHSSTGAGGMISG